MDNIIFLISVFLAGILSFFSPCILPLLPVYAGSCWMTKMVLRLLVANFQSHLLVYCELWPL